MNKEDKNQSQDFPFELEPILNYVGQKGKWQYLHSFCLPEFHCGQFVASHDLLKGRLFR